jgi:hypothetical protein
MIWARMLAYITGIVDQELLLRNEYLAAKNRILRAKIKGRLLLANSEKTTLAEIAHRLGRKVLRDVAVFANGKIRWRGISCVPFSSSPRQVGAPHLQLNYLGGNGDHSVSVFHTGILSLKCLHRDCFGDL